MVRQALFFLQKFKTSIITLDLLYSNTDLWEKKEQGQDAVKVNKCEGRGKHRGRGENAGNVPNPSKKVERDEEKIM